MVWWVGGWGIVTKHSLSKRVLFVLLLPMAGGLLLFLVHYREKCSNNYNCKRKVFHVAVVVYVVYNRRESRGMQMDDKFQEFIRNQFDKMFQEIKKVKNDVQGVSFELWI